MSKSNNDLDKYYEKLDHKMFPAGFAKFGKTKCVLPAGFGDYAEYYKNFDVRKGDVWVIAYPKTGTTWTQEMTWLIANDIDYEGAKVSLEKRFPLLELAGLIGQKHAERLTIASTKLSICESMMSPRFIKSHLPYELLPSHLWTVKPKIIYVTRNAKDTCLSHFHHSKNFEGYTGTADDFVDAFRKDIIFTPFWSHVNEFWKQQKNSENVMFVTYEEMKQNLPKVINRTAKFFNKRLTQDQIQNLIEPLSFAKMKENPALNHEDDLTKYSKEILRVDDQSGFITKGIIGAWKEEFSPEAIAKLDEYVARNEIPGGFDHNNNEN